MRTCLGRQTDRQADRSVRRRLVDLFALAVASVGLVIVQRVVVVVIVLCRLLLDRRRRLARGLGLVGAGGAAARVVGGVLLVALRLARIVARVQVYLLVEAIELLLHGVVYVLGELIDRVERHAARLKGRQHVDLDQAVRQELALALRVEVKIRRSDNAHDRHLGLHGRVEGALLERQQARAQIACAFGKDPHSQLQQHQQTKQNMTKCNACICI